MPYSFEMVVCSQTSVVAEQHFFQYFFKESEPSNSRKKCCSVALLFATVHREESQIPWKCWGVPSSKYIYICIYIIHITLLCNASIDAAIFRSLMAWMTINAIRPVTWRWLLWFLCCQLKSTGCGTGMAPQRCDVLVYNGAEGPVNVHPTSDLNGGWYTAIVAVDLSYFDYFWFMLTCFFGP